MTEPPPVSPISTGSGGTDFELNVATSYVVQLLRGEVPRGRLSGQAVSIRLQQRNQGHHVDDVVVRSIGPARVDRLFLQVKRGISFTGGDSEFCSAIGQCWREFSSEGFDPDGDLLGLAIDAGSNIQKVEQHFQELLAWAREHQETSTFVKQVEKFKQKNGVSDLYPLAGKIVSGGV